MVALEILGKIAGVVYCGLVVFEFFLRRLVFFLS